MVVKKVSLQNSQKIEIKSEAGNTKCQCNTQLYSGMGTVQLLKGRGKSMSDY